VLPVFVVVVLFFALLISYPWQVLSACTFAYLACLPLGYLSYQDHLRKDEEAARSAVPPSPPGHDENAVPGEHPPAQDGERPPRLN
jgi:CDP-diacylglycerol--serine O-phosphatidyltransferase